jgi:hypothetical protein
MKTKIKNIMQKRSNVLLTLCILQFMMSAYVYADREHDHYHRRRHADGVNVIIQGDKVTECNLTAQRSVLISSLTSVAFSGLAGFFAAKGSAKGASVCLLGSVASILAGSVFSDEHYSGIWKWTLLVDVLAAMVGFIFSVH